MYNTTLIIAEKELKDYIRDYRDTDKFIGYCKACNRYNSCWACPPFDFDTEEYIAPYKMAYIIGTKITMSEKTVRDNQGWDKCTKISYEIIEKVRYDLDKKLLELEKNISQQQGVFWGSLSYL